MQLYHNSQKAKYREPFGAVTIGSEVRLGLLVKEYEGQVSAKIRIWTDRNGEEFSEMESNASDEGLFFTGKIMIPSEPCLLWYCFVVEDANGTVYYGNKSDNLGGVGDMYMHMPPSYQITVYKDFEIPDWYRKSVAYQIFPDRFNRGSDWIERSTKCLENTDKEGPKTLLRQDWSDKPSYIKDERGHVTHWDFFGGTLKGITEKLDYLEALGIGTLYLNPIFKSLSNHRYDTGDYMEIDPRLGDDESFKELCSEAEKRGISIILDGVFNHTGNDSKYFDAYGNYGGNGAYENADSPYANWYQFKNPEHTEYESWWGVKDLPALDKDNPEYQEYIYGGEDSVIRHWLRLGAKGWRLDVADELTDEFIRGIKKAVKAEKEDGLLMGEVWEDASNKVSYGKMREYFLGDELDCVMNYPLRTALIDFLRGHSSGGYTGRRLMSLYENYPKPAMEANFNLMGSHDRIRILTMLGNDIDEKKGGFDNKALMLNESNYDLALKRLWLITVMQMTMPGVPCVYYGDEAGLEGGPDPHNRGTFPWGGENKSAFEIYRNAIALRKEWEVFTEGKFGVIETESDDLFAYRRYDDKDEMAVYINRCPYHGETVKIKSDCDLYDILNAEYHKSENGIVELSIPSYGAVILRKDEKLYSEKTDKSSGVLCHITSLPSKWGTGQFGKEAEDFVLKLKSANQSYWQILPLNPIDSCDSPYATSSAFAGNIYLISPEGLCEMGLISEKVLENALKKAEALLAERDLNGVKKLKLELLKKAYSSFEKNADYEDFCKENEFWLSDFCVFESLKDRYKGKPWQQWPKKYKKKADNLPEEVMEKAEFYRFCQYVFAYQWKKLRKFANENGIKILGDLPFYVNSDSADVWAQQELFSLDEDGYEKVTSGAPPDYFSEDGQIWNTSVYNWRAMEEHGYEWWLQRLSQAFSRYDLLRLDHFRGFEQYWEIPKGKKSVYGKWKFGPGLKLFKTALERFGKLPIIAEDLGEITTQVKNLVSASGFLSMDVFQFSYHERFDGEEYTAKENTVLYSGTHDNQTLKGWCETYKAVLGDSGVEADDIIKMLYVSEAPVVIVPVQDILGLDDKARMNTPGRAEDNWKWQFKASDFTDEYVLKLKTLTEESGRAR